MKKSVFLGRKKFFQKTTLLIFFALLIFISVFLILGNLKINNKIQELSSQKKFLEEKISRLSEEKEILESKISKAGSEDLIEKIGREELNLRKEGEEVVAFNIVPQKQGVSSTDLGGTNGWWSGFWEKIKNKF